MWNDLSMAQKSELMKMFIQNGIYDLNTIIKEYDSRHQSGDEATLPNYSQNVFAEGGNIGSNKYDTPDWDPDNPYHYHTNEGKKVVITPEDWEANKGKPYFKEVEAAVNAERTAHPGPEYEIDPKFVSALSNNYASQLANTSGALNYRNFARQLPEGYTINNQGVVFDTEGNAYVQDWYNGGDRYTYDRNNPTTFTFTFGPNNQRNVNFYPVNMEKRIKAPLPVDKTMNIATEKEKVIQDNIRYEFPDIGDGVINYPEHLQPRIKNGKRILKVGTQKEYDDTIKVFKKYDPYRTDRFIREAIKIKPNINQVVIPVDPIDVFNGGDKANDILKAISDANPNSYIGTGQLTSKGKIVNGKLVDKVENIDPTFKPIIKEYAKGGHLYQGYSEPTQQMTTKSWLDLPATPGTTPVNSSSNTYNLERNIQMLQAARKAEEEAEIRKRYEATRPPVISETKSKPKAVYIANVDPQRVLYGQEPLNIQYTTDPNVKQNADRFAGGVATTLLTPLTMWNPAVTDAYLIGNINTWQSFKPVVNMAKGIGAYEAVDNAGRLFEDNSNTTTDWLSQGLQNAGVNEDMANVAGALGVMLGSYPTLKSGIHLGDNIARFARDWRPFVPRNTNRYYRYVDPQAIEDYIKTGTLRTAAQAKEENPELFKPADDRLLLRKAHTYNMFSKGKPYEGGLAATGKRNTLPIVRSKKNTGPIIWEESNKDFSHKGHSGIFRPVFYGDFGASPTQYFEWWEPLKIGYRRHNFPNNYPFLGEYNPRTNTVNNHLFSNFLGDGSEHIVFDNNADVLKLNFDRADNNLQELLKSSSKLIENRNLVSEQLPIKLKGYTVNNSGKKPLFHAVYEQEKVNPVDLNMYKSLLKDLNKRLADNGWNLIGSQGTYFNKELNKHLLDINPQNVGLKNDRLYIIDGDVFGKGGQLGHITPYGQWQYPHQVTTIPSNNITMQGVNYPIVGVSDTGDTKVMLPGLDYLYDGNYVTEYPVR